MKTSIRKRNCYPRLVYSWDSSSDTAFCQVYLAKYPGVVRREDIKARTMDFLVRNVFTHGSSYEEFTQNESTVECLERTRQREMNKRQRQSDWRRGLRGRGRGTYYNSGYNAGTLRRGGRGNLE